METVARADRMPGENQDKVELEADRKSVPTSRRIICILLSVTENRR